MPLYEYKCKKCGRKLEKIRKFSDPPLTMCGSCGGELEQLLSSPAIRFKGSGWYVNDYGPKLSAPSGESSTDSSQSTEKKDTEKKQTATSKPSEPVAASTGKD